MIERRALRDDVAAEILARIVDGRLEPGAHLNETHLSVELGTSRTPLREALLGLRAQGVVAAEPGRGFRVPDLDRRELEEVLDALAALEPEAVRLTGRVPPHALMELQNHLARAGLIARPADLAVLAHRLQESVFGACPNRVVRDLVRQLGARSLRYLRAAREQGWDPAGWLTAWNEAVEALRTGQIDQAAERLARTRRDLAHEIAPLIPLQSSGNQPKS